jgi:GNAT superfamily N-acetyltransferase
MDSTVEIRPIRASDTETLRRFYEGLSADSRVARFMGASRGPTMLQADAFCHADHDHREAFVACVRDETGGPTRIVGHLCVEPDGAEVAEVAVAVADDFRRQGIGRRLLAAGVAWARNAGIRRLTATMLATNTPIIRLLTGLGLACRIRYADGNEARMVIELSPLERQAA